MKRTLKLLSVAALLGLGVTGLAACGETSSSTVTGPSIQATAEATSVNYGETLQLQAVGFQGAVSWTSSNTSIATVSAEGLVTGIIPGTVKITAIDEADNRAEIEISVVDPEATTSGTVTVDYDNLPTEILVDSKIDMDQYAEVKKVTNWYLTTEDTDIVKIEGHTIIGIAPGSYLVTLHAGRTARAIQGTVITEGKIDAAAVKQTISAVQQAAQAIAGSDSSGSLLDGSAKMLTGHLDKGQLSDMTMDSLEHLAAEMGLDAAGKTKEELVELIAAEEVQAPAR